MSGHIVYWTENISNILVFIMDIHDSELLNADKSVPKYSLAGRTVYAKCVSVYDGDTAQFVFRPSPKQRLCRYSCRMIGYNSAEIRGGSEAEKTQAQICKKALSDMILNKIVTLDLGEFDKYGRPLVTVHLGDIDVNKWMVEHDYGKLYMGKGAKEW